jgi:U4/U6.U5 tri-snRNP-associated protein 1
MGHKKEHKHKHKKEHKHKHKRKRRLSGSDDEKYDKKSRYEDDDVHDKKKKSNYDDFEEKSKRHRKKHRHNYEGVEETEIKEEVVVEEEDNIVPAQSATVPPASRPASSSGDIEPVPEGGKSHESLSIEETNKLRIKLGLKPLQVDDGSNNESGEKKEDEFVHKPAEDLWNKRKQDELRKKLLIAKEKRQQNKKLSKVKTLGEESDDEESAAAWVLKSKKKEAAVKRDKEMKRLEAEFGVGDLVQSQMGSKSMDAHYSERDLQGMSVEHNIKSFKEGKTQILVIKDKDVLDEDPEDVLPSVNIEDNEKY